MSIHRQEQSETQDYPVFRVPKRVQIALGLIEP
jgi:hypothetical protein